MCVKDKKRNLYLRFPKVFRIKQSLEGVVLKRDSEKFCENHKKTLVLECFFNDVAGVQHKLKKETPYRFFPVNFAKFF